ncbi:YicC/YloC family endoribonuclease [Robertkochia solimangrovi]|uniref:YicC/YloC family endoribonuclease n=1 Tax=Robertkochia solimangrovi TaxID=2213046 RepID=UPI00117F72CA|nr:YicC/YloC family endoribonuclease [Robertkochia solimangrovi]TRZ45920.1 YicC family protein [Robertkochia solimangrovi]
MIKSMTGFGKSIVQLSSKKITVELKSLNSKSLDINARIPSNYREKELDMRTLIANTLERGKIDLSLYIEITGEESNVTVNTGVVRQYVDQLKKVYPEYTSPEDTIELMKMAVRMPDALKTEKDEIDESEYAVIEGALKEALQSINDFRGQEGAILENDFVNRIKVILSLLKEVEALDPERLGSIRERLEKAVSDLKENVDQNRFEQELIFYLEKYDITEEKVRLANHLDYFLVTLEAAGSNGKKLGFICQEIGREINTIGSKANYAPMQKVVVQMKDELEKIKEQMLNVL